MGHILTDEELENILNNPDPPTICGFGGYKYGHKIDIYSFYLKQQFKDIDKKYPFHKDENNNKGKKGELLLCGIIDLTMWLGGFSLGKDYTVIHGYEDKTSGNSIDFKLVCKDKTFLFEAKNWNRSFVDKRTYDNKIRKRFFCNGINILMIREDKIPNVEKMYKVYPTDEGLPTINGQPINCIKISHFIDKRNDIFDVNWNLVFGVPQLTKYMGISIDIGKEFSLGECIQMGMPTWFITDYLSISAKTVYRKTKELGYNRRSSEYKRLVKYRDIR